MPEEDLHLSDPVRSRAYGPPASCRPSGVFNVTPQAHHREREPATIRPARTEASPVSALRRAPTMPPGANQSVPRVRHPACTCGCPAGSAGVLPEAIPEDRSDLTDLTDRTDRPQSTLGAAAP